MAMFRTCLILLALISIAAPAAEQPSQASVAASNVKPSPPGELVDIGGRRLHVECKGEAVGPTVIFEAGLSQFTAHSTYGKAQDLIAPFARVCIYDRAGLGWSDPVPGGRTHEDMIEDLHRLVDARSLSKPLVLVGHSMGGLLARFYARQSPDEVAGIVLVDASSEAMLVTPEAAEGRKAIIAQIDAGLRHAKEGVPVVDLPDGTSADVVMAFMPSVLRTVKQEYEAIDFAVDALRQSGGYGSLGDKPLAVIRRGRTATPPSEADRRWREMQEAMSSLSSRSFLVVAENSGHVIPNDEPAVVADTVRRILTMLE
jgi:pimeloyl-ACP methyl ester carboxylesterase